MLDPAIDEIFEPIVQPIFDLEIAKIAELYQFRENFDRQTAPSSRSYNQ
jgi:hypothetical protein